MAELTEKQKRFADYYIESGNASEAYSKVYSVKSPDVAKVNASRLLTNANVKKYIDELIKQKDKERIADQDEVLQFLTKVLRGEETEKIPIVGKDYFELVDNTPSIRDRTKAAELLGKRYAMFTEKQQIDANIGVTIVDDVDD